MLSSSARQTYIHIKYNNESRYTYSLTHNPLPVIRPFEYQTYRMSHDMHFVSWICLTKCRLNGSLLPLAMLFSAMHAITSLLPVNAKSYDFKHKNSNDKKSQSETKR